MPSKVQRFVRYSPRVEYSYRWNDTLYTGNRIGVDEIRFANKEEADDFINKYATKDLLDIYIDPMDPKESIVIKPIISHMSFVYTAIMYSIFSLIIFLLIYATHRNHRKIQQ